MQAPSTLLMVMVEAWALMPDCWLFAPATAEAEMKVLGR